MKKIICFLLAFTMLFALTTCKTKNTSEESTSETVSVEDNSNESQTETEESLESSSETVDEESEEGTSEISSEESSVEIDGEGRFYSLSDAYNKGLLQYEDIKAVADVRLEQEYAKMSDEKLAQEIKYMYLKQEREEGYPHMAENITIRDIIIRGYYGSYGNCHVVQLWCRNTIVLDMPYYVIIKDIEFYFPHQRWYEWLVVYEKIK